MDAAAGSFGRLGIVDLVLDYSLSLLIEVGNVRSVHGLLLSSLKSDLLGDMGSANSLSLVSGSQVVSNN